MKRGQKDVGHGGSAPLPPAPPSAPLSSVGSVAGITCYRHHGIIVPPRHVTHLLTLDFIIKHPLQILN